MPPSTGPPGASVLDSLVIRGESAYARQAYDTARLVWRVALTEAVRAGDSTREARILTGLGLAAYWLGDYGEARALGERALALKQGAGLDADLFRSYNALGLLAWNEGRLAEATVLFQKASEAARANGDEASLAKTANNLALVQTDQGDFARARAGFLEARQVSHRLGDARSEGRALNNLGMLDAQMGDPRSAIAALAEARVLFHSTGDRTGEQNALGQLGTAYDALGEPHLALAALDSALELSRHHGLRQDEATNLGLIAGLYRQAGDLQRALQLHTQANLIYAELGLPDEQGTNLRNAAEIHGVLGRPDLARANALEALRLHRSTGARLQELRDLLLLADVAATAAEAPAVVGGHLEAADRLSRELDARIARVEVALARAAIADRAGDARGVLRALRRAEHDLSLGGYGGEWQAAALRARAYARLSLLDSAATAGRAAVAAVEQVRGGFRSGLLRASFAADKAAPYSDLVETLLRMGRTEAAFEVADGARSHALLEHLAATSETEPSRATIRTLADGEMLLRRIDTLVSRLDVLEETPPAERGVSDRDQVRALATEVADARGSYEALLVHVTEGDTAGTTLLGGLPTKAEEVRRALLGDEALLEYLVTPDRVIAFVVTRGEVRSVATEIHREDLARQVRLARDLLRERAPPTTDREVLAALYRELVAPIERAGLVRGVRRLIIVPHSVLAYLPFAALRRDGTERFLVEDYALLYLPSAAALGVLRGSSGFVLAGNSPRSIAFAPFPKALPGSVREARAFRRAVGGADARYGAQATELSVREALAGRGMVHLATHGIMNARNPMFSRIELAPGRGETDDDGRLEVHELLALRVRAPLVFLSGCETGVGASWSTQFSRGEDYATLAQAFLYAGARSVAATLWPIEDDGAAAFAERFYAHLRTMAPAEALAASQRDLLASARYPSPYYWAGYQLIGESERPPTPHMPADRSVQQR